MSISNESTASRQFEASAEVFSTTWIKGTKIWQVVYTVFFLGFVGYVVFGMIGTGRGSHSAAPRNAGLLFFGALGALTVVCAIVGAYLYLRSRQALVLAVNGDTLTIPSRGESYSLADARLGLWPNIGVALHLHSGDRRFVLGGQGRCIGPSTPLDAESTPVVDARMPAADFDELLRLGGRAADRGPGPGEPTRSVLFRNSLAISQAGAFALRKKQRISDSLIDAQLFVDVDNETVRIVEPQNHTVDASAAVARTTATPAIYETQDGETNIVTRTAVLTLGVPGVPPITFGCTHAVASGKRFSWPAATPRVREFPPYVVSAGDFLTLVEKFGLAADLGDGGRTG